MTPRAPIVAFLAFVSADCMNAGWRRYVQPTFKNQGECVSYFSTFRGGVSK